MKNTGSKIVKIIILCLLDAAAIFGGLMLKNYLEGDYWFLRHENQPFQRFLMIAGIAVGILILLIVNLVVLLSLRTRQQPAAPEESVDSLKQKFLSGDPEQNLGAEDYVKLFTVAKAEKPRLEYLLNTAIGQIETFYEDKTSIDKVMRLQNVSYAPILHAIAQSEENLLKVMRSLIVDISIWNPKHLEDDERRDSYMEVYQSIEHKLEISKRNLKSFHDLLMRVRTLKTEDVAEDNTIQALIKALESTAKR